MPRFKVEASELLFYCTKEIEAVDKEEAINRYLLMLENGDVDVHESDMQDIKVEAL